MNIETNKNNKILKESNSHSKLPLEKNVYLNLSNCCIGYSFFKVLELKGLLKKDNETKPRVGLNKLINLSQSFQKNSEKHIKESVNHNKMFSKNLLEKYNLTERTNYKFDNVYSISTAMKHSLGIHLNLDNVYIINFQNTSNPDLNHSIAIQKSGDKFNLFDVNLTIENKNDHKETFFSQNELFEFIDKHYNSNTGVFVTHFSNNKPKEL